MFAQVVDLFGVEAIPHFAFLSAGGALEAALIQPTEDAMRADVAALAAARPPPHASEDAYVQRDLTLALRVRNGRIESRMEARRS